MATTKQIVCLANSRKQNGRCVAGKEIIDGKPAGWIRPVSDREHEEVSEYERQYHDGKDPIVGDYVRIPLLDSRPKRYQQENYLLDPEGYWKKVGHAGWDELVRFIDEPSSLWVNGHSTKNGVNDHIPLYLANNLKSSLCFIHVDRLVISVFAPGADFGDTKRRVQARFTYARIEYHLWITDPVYERRYLAAPDGDHQLSERLLTISLGEPYNNMSYKLVAALIGRPSQSHSR